MAPVPTSPTAFAYTPVAHTLKGARHGATPSLPPLKSSGMSTISAHGGRPQERRDVPVRAEFAFDPMEDALAAFARGEFLVVMDDENRENEGDLITAASECTTEKMAWMIKHTRCAPLLLLYERANLNLSVCSGYICISLPKERLDELNIAMMVPQNEERHRTAYTVTVDYKHGTCPRSSL